MLSCLNKTSKATKNTKEKSSLASLRSARGRLAESPRNPGSSHYVIEKLLWNHQVATKDDMLKVQCITGGGQVVLKPLFKNSFVVSMKEFKRDYKEI